MPGTTYHVEVNPALPERLARLEELANNLWYSWDRPTRALFSHLHPALWNLVGHSPKAFLKRVDEQRLLEAAQDPVFLGTYNRVLSEYDTYHKEPIRGSPGNLGPNDLIAYFCAEFGFHESLPIYSGGLGILAGDHCKAASDMRLPFVGVGLLYRQGYFHQSIDRDGNQQAVYTDSDFEELPITPVAGHDGGGDLRVAIDLPGRALQARVWQVRIGHVMLYLLDTDLEENEAHDRDIAHQLYGGDRTTRIEQEIVLGVGGVRALLALGLRPTAWHINEGHAAFLVLERIRMLVTQGLDFASALEAVACNTVFTTHTAVAAGHDHFTTEMIRHYFERWCRDHDIGLKELLALGHAGESADFNMTALAVRGSRFQNGVSRIHGGVSSRICAGLWPQIEPDQNPVSYVTNAVHVPTFLATDWNDLFDRYLGHGWSQRLDDPGCWSKIYSIPDYLFWSVRQSLKSQMLYLIRHRIAEQNARNHGSEAHLDRVLALADPANPNVLTIGFARRFATYKRATLLFQDLKWLQEIVSDRERPVIFLFAGKAHPADQPGKDLIRRIAEVARMPEFEGRILLVEGYDLQLSRRLVSGVDVWLNNPVYPLEASGTSGMKAAMNGVINLSVLDGWWAEACDGRNGWAIKPATSTSDDGRRNQEEARTLYELLQDSVIPLYYGRGPAGYSPGWLAMAKHAIATVLPHFNSTRMLSEYLTRFYVPAASQGRRYLQEGCSAAREVAAWKAKVRAAWHQTAVRRHDHAPRRIHFGESIRVEVAVNLDGLVPSDVVVELMVGRPGRLAEDRVQSYRLDHVGPVDKGKEHLFALEIAPELCGKLEYHIRVYPYHELLTHRFEMGMMRWL
ncbi:MAG: alpha-glucan family phosphorylase [Betaproteobacteria bacterium]|nr:alpha-glucan family phosphorylase [Betaproteobacteria bacterium]